MRVAPKWSRYPLYIRLNSSDVTAFKQIFLEKEYDVVAQIRNGLVAVIDAGANIGLTSVFLADRYPDLTVCAIEPEAENFDLLLRNTVHYPAIRCVHGALWDRDEMVDLVSKDTEDWAFRVTPVREDSKFAVPAYRISTLLRTLHMDRVSLLKMDVEGAEFEILGDAANWIDKVDNIVIELHEQIQPGCSDLFRRVVRDFDICAKTHELTLACRQTVVPSR